MGLKVVTAPTVEPVTLAEAKLHQRVDLDADDALISMWISAIREHAEHLTERALAPASFLSVTSPAKVLAALKVNVCRWSAAAPPPPSTRLPVPPMGWLNVTALDVEKVLILVSPASVTGALKVAAQPFQLM